MVEARVGLPSFAHRSGPGSRLRLSIATPGRNHATWEFDNPDYGDLVPTQLVARTRPCRRRWCCRCCPASTVPPLPLAPVPRPAGPGLPALRRHGEPARRGSPGTGSDAGPYHGRVSPGPLDGTLVPSWS